jgi:serine/threonine protein kinase/tetratricopeptide (TPR) repeat protein
MVGKKLAHYEITEKLGVGGMGEVYRARDTKLAREVAIKVLPAEFATDHDRRKRFTREAQAIAALKHPNIVTIYSVENAANVHFITMELVEGETLAQRIPNGGLPLDRFFDYSIALADAISSAHDQGITHRDLKPANVMFDKDGRLKVLDFGLAKLLADNVDPEQARTLAQGSDTAVGQILGTAAYMSPEQAEGKPIDHRSDIFSLGIMLYEMATGVRPFQGDTNISTISSILKDTPASVSEIKQTLPRHLGRIVGRCLEKDPDKRYHSGKDIRNDLEGLKKEVDSGDIAQTLTSASSMSVAPAPSRPWLPWTIAGAVVVIVAVIALWMLRTTGPADVAKEGAAPGTSARSSGGSAGASSSAVDDRKMTVVLPFGNLGPAEDAYFAAGMSEEITSRLAAVSGMGVISRTSATQYDRTGKTMRQIGEDLGVDYVLEGTVRWAKRADGTGRVRITPQLIRVADDTHMWSETYDREIDDIFEVQTEIATHVIDALGITLLGSERELVEDTPTQNMEAYKLYLQARDLKMGSVVEQYLEYDLEKTALLDKATELDPQFVEAWAELSMHHAHWYHSPMGKTEARLSLARAALQRAEAVDPDHFRTHLAQGQYLYYGFRDYDRALDEFLIATEMVPNEAEARERVGYIYRRQGKLNECVENLKTAVTLNPQDPDIPYNLALTYRAMREFELAFRYFDRVMEIDPERVDIFFEEARLMVSWKGDLDTALELLDKMPEGDTFFYRFGRSLIFFLRREYSQALDEARQVDASVPFVRALKLAFVADIECLRTSPEEARGALEAANEALVTLLESEPGNHLLRQQLALNLALQGRHDAAVREAKLAVDLTAKDRYEGPASLENLAGVYALVGRHDEAIDLIERLLSMVYQEAITRHDVELNPTFDSLREHPRFKDLLPKKNL